MQKRYVAAAFVVACLLSGNVRSAEWSSIEGVKLGTTTLPATWSCDPPDKLSLILGIKGCKITNPTTFRNIPIKKIEVGFYNEHAGKAGIIYIHFNAEETPKFGKLINTDLGKPTKLSEPIKNVVTLTWERKSYILRLVRDDNKKTGSISIIANWVGPQ